MERYDRVALARKGLGMELDPHANGKLVWRGNVEQARGVVVMLHGRGAGAQDILALWNELEVDGLTALAPQAAAGTWYPRSFLAPLDANQPYLDSALNKVEAVMRDLLGRGFTSGRIALLGFSQGACLASEFVARHPRNYGGVMALTGGLIGPPGTKRNYAGSLHGTPVFLGSGDPDMHVPFECVEETAEVLGRMGATVDLRRYEGMGHTINADELDACRKLLQAMTAPEAKR